MRHQTPLKRFEYCVAGTAELRLRLTTFNVDFEKEILSLNGGELRINAAMHPGFGINLIDQAEDALVFSLDGILEDGSTINTCSGLLVVQPIKNWNMRTIREWQLSVYLYDEVNFDREIKLNICMSALSENAQLN